MLALVDDGIYALRRKNGSDRLSVSRPTVA